MAHVQKDKDGKVIGVFRWPQPPELDKDGREILPGVPTEEAVDEPTSSLLDEVSSPKTIVDQIIADPVELEKLKAALRSA